MLCSNCGKNEANVRYTRIINGEKTEFALCEDCAKKMGLEDIDFNIPINFSLLPSFAKIENERCPKCGLTYDDFVNNGKFGCAECYDTFSNKLDSILKNLHGTSKHIGRKPKNIVKAIDTQSTKKEEKAKKTEKKVDEKQEKINKLNKDLQKAIKDERYEDAAKIRDEIKKLQ